MLERQIEKKVVEYAKSLGMLSYKFTSPSTRGVPDRMFINTYGFVFFIEFKSEGKVLNPLQQLVIGKMEKNNTMVYVVDSVIKGIVIINQYLTVRACSKNMN